MNARQEGFTLVEVVIALVMMAIILTTLGGLTFSMARTAVIADNIAARQAASLEMVNRYSTLPFNQLVSVTDSVGSANNWYHREVTVTGGGTARTIQVVTTPRERGVPASTVVLIRNAIPSGGPLCTSGC